MKHLQNILLVGLAMLVMASPALPCDSPITIQVPGYMEREPDALTDFSRLLSAELGGCDDAVRFLYEDESGLPRLAAGDTDLVLMGAGRFAAQNPDLGQLFVGYAHETARDYLDANSGLEFDLGSFQSNGLMVDGARLGYSNQIQLQDSADFGLDSDDELTIRWASQMDPDEVTSIVNRPAGYYPMMLVSPKQSWLSQDQLDAVTRAFSGAAQQQALRTDETVGQVLSLIPDDQIITLSDPSAQELTDSQLRLLDRYSAVGWPLIGSQLQCAQGTCQCGQRNVCSRKCCDDDQIQWD